MLGDKGCARRTARGALSIPPACARVLLPTHVETRVHLDTSVIGCHALPCYPLVHYCSFDCWEYFLQDNGVMNRSFSSFLTRYQALSPPAPSVPTLPPSLSPRLLLHISLLIFSFPTSHLPERFGPVISVAGASSPLCIHTHVQRD